MFLAAAMVASFASSALAAPGYQTGKGVDGTPKSPADPTQSYDDQLKPAGLPVHLYADGDPAGPKGGIGVAVGRENDPAKQSVGRASISGSSKGLRIYAEDYTDGNVIAGAVNTFDNATGCSMGCDKTHDAIVIILEP